MKRNSKSTKGKFKNEFQKFPDLLIELENSQAYERHQIPRTLNRGIYVFYENGMPIYVGRSGRTGRFKTRIQEHSRRSSGHNTATFAFLIAKENYQQKNPGSIISREKLAETHEFVVAKERIAKMQIKFIEIEDPVVQTLFEVYASLELETPYNEWGTH